MGHTGTLDPDAEGVLPICVGRATKLADYIMAGQKEYLAEVTLGITTTTEDSSGDILEEKEVVFNEERITEVINTFVGEIFQTPPMYSAIKVDGKKLYELARQGKEIERKQRKINIYSIEIKKFMPPNKVEILVNCSKGTYIRSLCSDIGKELGCGGHMSSLVRTKSGSFTMESAITLEQLKQVCNNNTVEENILSMETALKGYNKFFVDQKGDKLLHNGCKIYDYFFKAENPYEIGDTVTAYDSGENLVGLFTVIHDDDKNKVCIKPLKILL